MAGEQKRLDAKLEWLAAYPQLRKKYKRAVSQHNALLEDPEELVRCGHISKKIVPHAKAFKGNEFLFLKLMTDECI